MQGDQIIFHGGTFGGIDTPEAAAQETPKQTILRWLDVTGSLTRTYSRRAWIMESDPDQRAYMFMTTEYERWLMTFCSVVACIGTPIVVWYMRTKITMFCL